VNSVIIILTPSSLKPEEYRIHIPAKGNHLFPSLYKEIDLETNDISVMKRTYNPKYHELSIGEWLSVHRDELEPGDKLIIEVVVPMKRYRLKKATSHHLPVDLI